MTKFGTRPPVPAHQADATLDQDNPVSETEYTVLDTTKNARIISIQIKATYTGTDDANDNIKVIITIDGQTITCTLAGTSLATATNYYINLDQNLAEASQVISANQFQHRTFLLEGRSIKIVALVTDGGTSNVTFTNLAARVKYAKY